MKIISLSFVCIVLINCNTQTSKTPLVIDSIVINTPKLTQEQISQLDTIDIKFQIRGFCYAFSSNKNKEKSRGEAHSDNLPKLIDSNFPKRGLYLLINTNEKVILDSSYLGCKLYLVNSTDSLVTLKAQDSRIDILPEAMDKKGEWRPMGYNPSSWCGNSYHKVKLDKNEYWEFDTPIFKGPFKTKMRYTLRLNDSTKISSNEIDASINYEQLVSKSKQGHAPNNLMDPYLE